jgi:hypothetical protein
MKKHAKIPHPETCSTLSPDKSALQSIEAIVDHHIAYHRERAAKELKFYKTQPNLEQAIEVSSLAKIGRKRHPHQRRIPRAALEESRRRLSVVDFENTCKNFDTLHTLVEQQIGDIPGIGRLTIYDTAQRIGVYLGFEPELIYLHAGVVEGAKALGLDVSKHVLMRQEMPEPFYRLKPYEIEDCLCIYKAELRRICRKMVQSES